MIAKVQPCYIYTLLSVTSLFFSFSAMSEPVRNPALIDSPWPSWHRTSGAQSSTPIAGPINSNRSIVQSVNYKKTGGDDFGVSPFLIISEAKYRDAPKVRTVWGSGTNQVYKYSMNGEDFRFQGSFPLTGLPSINWNLQGNLGSQGSQVVIPQPLGLRDSRHKGTVCYGKKPSLLVLRDGTSLNSPIRCLRKFEFTDEVLRKPCNVPKRWRLSKFGKTATFFTTLQTGEIAVKITYNAPFIRGGENKQYVAILDKDLTKLKQCAHIDDSESTNAVPTEYLGGQKTAMYWPMEAGIVKMTYDAATNQIIRNWKQPVNFRGRTGTTPTLVGHGRDKFLVVVDSKCVVTSVLTGNIDCHEDNSASRLVIIRRDQTQSGKPIMHSLPDFITTVENSPSAEGNTVVVANYGGYKVNPEAKGVAAIRYNAHTRKWYTAWANPSIQMNGITTISTGSNMVYSSGVERREERSPRRIGSGTRTIEKDIVYMYGLRFKTDKNGKSGEIVFRKKIGEPECRMIDCSLLDQGNNTVINDDSSLIYSTGEELVRIYQR